MGEAVRSPACDLLPNTQCEWAGEDAALHARCDVWRRSHCNVLQSYVALGAELNGERHKGPCSI
jgi:hypothetical protein